MWDHQRKHKSLWYYSTSYSIARGKRSFLPFSTQVQRYTRMRSLIVWRHIGQCSTTSEQEPHVATWPQGMKAKSPSFSKHITQRRSRSLLTASPARTEEAASSLSLESCVISWQGFRFPVRNVSAEVRVEGSEAGRSGDAATWLLFLEIDCLQKELWGRRYSSKLVTNNDGNISSTCH